ncbi:phage holin family protein [Cytobacillus sp. IB215316]|uniref:phage holin family protein n=1 Tax=Cytobacillus sp. IB215316 TaxID=3097354 RepID=UPI002A0DA97E|nr:phage holin family protein [Cytobacillus sp. IB215316]MDX8361568.1 phage holin family protein [Cytobacillus sp. IB215316]
MEWVGIGYVISFLIEGVGLAIAILLAMMVIDCITGLLVGLMDKNLNGANGFKGLLKKMYVLLLISAVYLLEKIVFSTGYIGDGVTIAYIIIEFISITENGGKLGVPIPRQIREVIKVFNSDASTRK